MCQVASTEMDSHCSTQESVQRARPPTESRRVARTYVSASNTTTAAMRKDRRFEPIAWAEELIEPTRAVDHPQLPTLHVVGSRCGVRGRIEEAIRYWDAAQMVVRSGGNGVPFGMAGSLGSVYVVIGQPDRWVEWCRAELAGGRDTRAFISASLVICLAVAGSADEAMALAEGLIGAAEATG